MAAGGVEALISLLTLQTPECCVIAANTLKILALSPANKARTFVFPLFARILAPAPAALLETLGLLTPNLFVAVQLHIPQSGGLKALVNLMLEEGVAGGREASAGALRNLATVKANKTAILEAGALPCLVSLVRQGAVSIERGWGAIRPCALSISDQAVRFRSSCSATQGRPKASTPRLGRSATWPTTAGRR